MGVESSCLDEVLGRLSGGPVDMSHRPRIVLTDISSRARPKSQKASGLLERRNAESRQRSPSIQLEIKSIGKSAIRWNGGALHADRRSPPHLVPAQKGAQLCDISTRSSAAPLQAYCRSLAAWARTPMISFEGVCTRVQPSRRARSRSRRDTIRRLRCSPWRRLVRRLAANRDEPPWPRRPRGCRSRPGPCRSLSGERLVPPCCR